jgi:hypothetical protein
MHNEWNKYLADLSDQKIASVVSKFWEQAVLLCKPKELLVPSAGFCEDGAYQLAWDLDEHHLDIDIDFAKLEWFYMNRKTDERDELCLSRMWKKIRTPAYDRQISCIYLP